MEERNALIGTNLRKMYVSDVVAVVGVIAGFACTLHPGGSAVSQWAAVLAMIINLIALVRLRKVHGDYAKALLYLVLGLVLGFFEGGSGMIARLIGLVVEIFGLMKVYYIVRGTNTLLKERDLEDIVAKGDKAWECLLFAAMINIFVSFFGMLGMLMGMLGTILGFLALVFRLSYLKAASEVW